MSEQTRNKTAWYRVVSTNPISVDFQNGRATAFPYGVVFEADPNLRDIRRLTQLMPRPIVNMGPVDPTGGKGIPMPGPSSHMPPNTVPTAKTNLPPGIHDMVRSWER